MGSIELVPGEVGVGGVEGGLDFQAAMSRRCGPAGSCVWLLGARSFRSPLNCYADAFCERGDCEVCGNERDAEHDGCGEDVTVARIAVGPIQIGRAPCDVGGDRYDGERSGKLAQRLIGRDGKLDLSAEREPRGLAQRDIKQQEFLDCRWRQHAADPRGKSRRRFGEPDGGMGIEQPRHRLVFPVVW